MPAIELNMHPVSKDVTNAGVREHLEKYILLYSVHICDRH